MLCKYVADTLCGRAQGVVLHMVGAWDKILDMVLGWGLAKTLDHSYRNTEMGLGAVVQEMFGIRFGKRFGTGIGMGLGTGLQIGLWACVCDREDTMLDGVWDRMGDMV